MGVVWLIGCLFVHRDYPDSPSPPSPAELSLDQTRPWILPIANSIGGVALVRVCAHCTACKAGLSLTLLVILNSFMRD